MSKHSDLSKKYDPVGFAVDRSQCIVPFIKLQKSVSVVAFAAKSTLCFYFILSQRLLNSLENIKFYHNSLSQYYIK